MSRSTNPLSKLVTTTSAALSQATNEGQAFLQSSASALDKAELDNKISRLSGELNSGLNGMSSAAGEFGAKLGGMKSEFSSIGAQIQSKVAGGINSLQSAVGSTSNIAADISGSLNKLTGGNLAGGLMGIAGKLSGGLGMLNNILSLKRGANLPAGGELFMKQGTAIKLAPGAANDWRVRLQANWALFNSPWFKILENTGGVVWPYMPNITVSTKANYNSPDTIHANYTFYSYKNSVVDDITITGEFSAETEKDAAYWIAATLFFKTATKMFFGQGERAGNPPIICNLTGYGSKIFDSVPVIIKDFSVDLKDDVNYIRCDTFGANTWVPVLSTITVKVSPIYNRSRLREFSLEEFAKGNMTQGKDGIGFI